MKNTLDNKRKFYMSFWGQKLIVQNFGNYQIRKINFNNNSTNSINSSHLELIDLAEITDEDAIAVNKIFDPNENTPWTYCLRYKHEFPEIFTGEKEESEVYISRVIESVDYLKSKGYALSFMGLSVEKLIEYGWIKLKP